MDETIGSRLNYKKVKINSQHCGGYAPSIECVWQMKCLCFLAVYALTVVGCKPKEVVISGQIFIVTKGRENIVLGGEKVALLDAAETRIHFNSKAVEWSNALAMAQAKVDQATLKLDLATGNLSALYKEELDNFAKAKKHHDNIMRTASTSSREWDDAFDWSRKLDKKIRDLQELKRSSSAYQQLSVVRTQIDDALREQAILWDEINWPSAKYFSPRIENTTTDSEGRFKFVVPKSRAKSNLILFAKAERKITDETENYWWMVNVNLNGREAEDFILSNENIDCCGVWRWFDNRPRMTVMNSDEQSPMEKWMIGYQLRMESANRDREHRNWLEKLNKGE